MKRTILTLTTASVIAAFGLQAQTPDPKKDEIAERKMKQQKRIANGVENKETLDAFAATIARIISEDAEFLQKAPHTLPISRPDFPLVCRFTLETDCLEVTVEATTNAGRTPGRDSFAWTVLTALAGDVDASAADDGTVTLTLRKHRGGSPEA